MEYRHHLFATDVGWVGLLGSEKGLRRLSLGPTLQEAMEVLGPELDGSANDPAAFAGAQGSLERYLDGDPAALDDIPLDLSGAPPFFAAAWQACRTIPAGETRSYAWLAWQAGSPKAVRAAGQSMARNRFPLIIPCHRVISSDGELGGYGAGGARVKAALLERERLRSG
jgi:methylated-DNA-[protein]-cysteine S-methyltransferase